MKPTFGSLFAGVGGFDLGFENAGFECRFQVEWDAHCQQTLAHHWPDVPRWGDVTEVNGADLPPVDVITYGFPCQDLSVAGKRAGLDGNRSGLFFEAVRIITEMREATDGRYPTWAVAENVAGLLNADNGHAMGRCLDELAKAGSLVLEWCLVDAQWFGVPQRRRRVFLASCFDPATAERCPDPLFPLASSSSRNPAQSEQERQEPARTLGEGSGERGIQRVTGTLAAGAHPGSYNGQDAYSDMLLPFVKAKLAQTDSDDETLETDRPNPTINQFDQGDSRATTAIVFTAQRVGEEPRIYTDATPSLLSRMGTGGNNTPMVAQTCAEIAGPLEARDSKDINSDGADSKLIIAFSHTTSDGPQPSEDHFPTLTRGSGGQAVAQPVGVDTYNGDINTDTFHTLRTTTQNYQPHVVPSQPDLAVRRLTPLECERLMGWPDNHTLHRTDGKPNSDSTRYRMCGNGVVAPVAQWIAKHLHNTLTDD